MNTSCPRCASYLDTVTDICETCSWAAPYRVRPSLAPRRDVSYSERYRTSGHRAPATATLLVDGSVARGRVFVIVSFVAVAATLAIIVMGSGSV